ncbi:general odorant-binding protein 57c [Drosophila erecta]|uniref:Odorant-binding protein 57c n=1 Tax=Drosophila erecta TaxID=7220 RepID=B3NK85_DROER|nr:general odorant-binding protein 57c [Drosophila erecta]EDV55306.1 Odorant-binding protein 57c [Drosophila erecta]
MFKLGLICILAVSVVSIQSLSLLEETNYVSDCLASNNISQAEFQELVDRNSSEEEDLENTERRYKCFIHCLGEKGNLLDANGYLDVSRIDEIEQVSDELREILYDCKKIYDEEKDHCEYAFRMVICVTDSFEQSDEVSEAEKNTNKLNE